MRRTPSVFLVLMTLLGLSGCAGLPGRLAWPPSSTDRSAVAESPPPGRFSWWVRPQDQAKNNVAAADLAEAGHGKSQAVSTTAPGDVWPEPKSDWTQSGSEWLARRFPVMTRIWNGNASESASDAHPGNASDVIRVSARPRPKRAVDVASADNEVRPADASEDDDLEPRRSESPLGKRKQFVPPLVPTPLLAQASPDSSPERSSDVELDISNSGPAKASQPRFDDEETSTAEPEPAPAPSVNKRPRLLMASVDHSPADVPAADHNDAEAVPTPETSTDSTPAAAPTDDPAPPSQVPPAPPNAEAPSPTLPPPPSPDDKEKEESEPEQQAVTKPDSASSEPEVPTAPPSEDLPPQRSTAAARIAERTQAVSPAFGQRLAAAPDEPIYASPPPMAPPLPRRRFLGLFLVEDRTEPLASPQFPPATFPATYYAQTPTQDRIQATPQENTAHHHHHHVATVAAKKPCVLTEWFQKIKNRGLSFGCPGGHHGESGPCCQGCTCYVGKNKATAPSPQANLASTKAYRASARSTLSSRALPARSTGSKPGDVTEEGKLFERVSFDSFDKSPQR